MKFIPYIKYALLIICVITFVIGLASYDSANERTVTAGLDVLFTWSFVLFVLAIVSAVLMPLIGIMQNPKSATRSMIGLGVVAVVFIISYVMASDVPMTMPSGRVVADTFELKFADMSLYSMYIAFAGVILTIVGTEIYKIFK